MKPPTLLSPRRSTKVLWQVASGMGPSGDTDDYQGVPSLTQPESKHSGLPGLQLARQKGDWKDLK